MIANFMRRGYAKKDYPAFPSASRRAVPCTGRMRDAAAACVRRSASSAQARAMRATRDDQPTTLAASAAARFRASVLCVFTPLSYTA
jgi:hypothetical protein